MKTTLLLKYLLFCLFILLNYFNFSECFAQTPTGVLGYFGRGMYVDKFINVYADASNVGRVDDVYSLLGEGTYNSSLDLYQKEIDLLEYCEKNHITYLVLFELNTLFANKNLNHSNGNGTLENNLCRFMQAAKSNYCIEAFGASISNPSQYSAIALFNNSLIPPMVLSSTEESLITDVNIQNAIKGNIISTDPLFPYTQPLRLGLSLYRHNLLGTCADFDVITAEVEFWHSGYGTWAKFTTLIDYLNSFSVNTEIYLARLLDAGNSGITAQNMVNYMDGTDPTTDPKRVGRILEVNYREQNADIEHPFSNNTDMILINTDFKNSVTNNYSGIHPLFSAEDKVFYDNGANVANYQGSWMIHPYYYGGSTPEIARNIFTVEKYYYDDWRTNSNAATDTTQMEENKIRPGGAHWYVSKFMEKYFNKPAIVYRSDINGCISSMANIQFTYCGPIERNTTYTLNFYDHSSNLFYSTGSQTVNRIEINNYSSIPQPNVIAPITISSVPIDNSNAYKVEMILQYSNHDNHGGSASCGSYTYTQDVWVSSQPKVIAFGNLDASGNVCSDEQVILIANMNTGTSSAIKWYRDNVQVGTGPFYTLDSKDYDLNYAGLSTYVGPGSHTFYFTITDASCGTSPVASNNVALNIKNNSQVNPISAVCTAGQTTVNLTAQPLYSSATYNWCTGETSSTITAYHGGKYSVEITQENGCSRLSTIVVPDKPVIQINSNSGCSNNLEEISYGSGGNGHFAWYRYNPSTNTWVIISGFNNYQLNSQPP